MRSSKPFIKVSTISLNYERNSEKTRPVCAKKRSRSVDSFLRQKKKLPVKKSSVIQISRGSVQGVTKLDVEHASTSTTSESKQPSKHSQSQKEKATPTTSESKQPSKHSQPQKEKATPTTSESKQPSKHSKPQNEKVVSLCPTVHVKRYRRVFARRWATADTSSSSSVKSSDEEDEHFKIEKTRKIPSNCADFSNVFRERSYTWCGEFIQSYKSPPLKRCSRSDNQGVLVFYADNHAGKLGQFEAEQGKAPLRPCICTPSQPPSVVCSSLNLEEEDEENRMIYLKRLMIWVTFLIKLILFTSLWVLLLYWFLMSAGFVNESPEPIVLQEELNTFIEKIQDFKFFPINNTYDGSELEVRMQGPFADSNVFLNCQFERLYFSKDKFNRTDVNRDDADDVEVDHRIYEDSYSAVTSTTTRRTMTYSHTSTRWTWTWLTYWTWFLFSQIKSWKDWGQFHRTHVYTRTRSMTWWTFTTITARLTRYNLSRHPMTSFTVQEPYNFVPWGNVRTYGYTFRNFRAVGGRLHGHRHYANLTTDANVTVTYGLKYVLNMTTMIEFINNTELDTVAFAIEITKGYGETTTTTTPPPPVVIKPNDGIKYGLIVVGLILALLFLQTNRMLALFIMAMACASILAYLHLKPGAYTIASWLHLDYLLELLFVMMLVAATADTGFYDLVAFTIYNLCFGSIFGITFIMCAWTFVLAVIMDSVAAILFVTPFAVRTVEHGQMNPMPVLLSMILYCNLASVLDGDYNYVNYNIMKGYDRWQATEGAFKETKFHQKTMPGVIVAAAVTAVYLMFVFRHLKPHLYTAPEAAMLIHRQTLLRIAASGITRSSRNWDAVRNQLIEWHHELDQERLRRLADIGPAPVRERFNTITDMSLLLKIGLVLAIFCVFFAVRRYGLFGLGSVTIGMIVFICMGYLLLILNINDLNTLFRRLQWATIIAFLSIFFIERSLQTMRLNKRIFQFLSGLLPDDKAAVPFTVMRYLQWGSFAVSAIFSNFGAVTTMRLVAQRFGDMMPDRVSDLVYAVTFGCNVGGSATALGTGAAIACLASAWQQGYRVSACKYLIFMLPITLVNMLCVYFTWVAVMS